MVKTYRELNVYRMSIDGAMRIFTFSKEFPIEERYPLTDQIRRSSRSVCANIAEAWRKRRYKAAFISKLSDSESEAAETQVWADIAVRCGYLDRASYKDIDNHYEVVIGKIVRTIDDAESWLIVKKTSVLKSPTPRSPVTPSRA